MVRVGQMEVIRGQESTRGSRRSTIRWSYRPWGDSVDIVVDISVGSVDFIDIVNFVIDTVDIADNIYLSICKYQF